MPVFSSMDARDPMYAGAVVATEHIRLGSGDYREDAVVWSGNDFDRVALTARHDGLYDEFATAIVDAPSDIREAYAAKKAADAALENARENDRAYASYLDAETASMTVPSPGKIVEVVAGRKVPLGTRGRVVDAGYSKFGAWVCLEGGIFTSAKNVKVVE